MPSQENPEINGEDFVEADSYFHAMTDAREDFKMRYGPGAAFAVTHGFESGARWGLEQTADPKPEEMWQPEYEPNEYDEAFPVRETYVDVRSDELARFSTQNPFAVSSVSSIDLQLIWEYAYDLAYGKGYKHGKSAGALGASGTGT